MSESYKASPRCNSSQIVEEQQRRRVALVVGVNSTAQESSIPPLLHAEDDAQAVAARLICPECNFTLYKPPLLGSQAKTTILRDALLDIIDKLGGNDTLLFYFSGHGQPMQIESDRSDVYLVTYDFNKHRVKQDENIHLSMRWLQDKILRSSDIGRILILLDCCYSGWIGNALPDPYLEDLEKTTPFLSECAKYRQLFRHRRVEGDPSSN